MAQPAVSRYILIGAMLVALMAARPQGLFGTHAGGDRLMAEAAARAQARLEGVRRPAGDRRPRPARRRGRDRQRDRAERRRQDDALQPRHRRLRARRGRDPASRGGRIVGLAPHEITRLGHRAHVPDAAAVPEHDREGERDGGGVRPHARRRRPLDPAHAGHAPRGAGDPRARGGEARVLRAAADGLPLEPARLLALVREPAPARDRPRDGDRRAHPPPRRAGRGDEPEGDARDHGADRPAARPRAATRSS